MLAATESGTAIIVAVIAAAVACVTGITALIGKLKESKDTREIGIIHETQDSLVALAATQRAELVATRVELGEARNEIVGLRSQITEMRAELAMALQHHAECETARSVQEQEIADLRAQLQEGLSP